MRFAILIGALALAGCNQGDAPTAGVAVPKGPAPAPAQQARLVPRPGAVAAPTGAAGSQPMAAGSLPADHPPIGALPPGHPVVDPAAPAAGSQPVVVPAAGGAVLKGTIDVAPALRAQVKAGAVLFIIVRQDLGEGQRGTMLAAQKVPVTGPDMFPLTYQVSSADVMMQGSQLAGAVRIEARVDGDGDALSKLPGDLTGGPLATEVGKEGVNFVLETTL